MDRYEFYRKLQDDAYKYHKLIDSEVLAQREVNSPSYGELANWMSEHQEDEVNGLYDIDESIRNNDDELLRRTIVIVDILRSAKNRWDGCLLGHPVVKARLEGEYGVNKDNTERLLAEADALIAQAPPRPW